MTNTGVVKVVLPVFEFSSSIVKIQTVQDCLIFMMGIPILSITAWNSTQYAINDNSRTTGYELPHIWQAIMELSTNRRYTVSKMTARQMHSVVLFFNYIPHHYLCVWVIDERCNHLMFKKKCITLITIYHDPGLKCDLDSTCFYSFTAII